MPRWCLKRNHKALIKQAAWAAFGAQILLLCFLAVGVRDGEIRSAVIGPIMERIGSGDDGNGLDQGTKLLLDEEGAGGRTGVQHRAHHSSNEEDWKFRDFDVEGWNSSQELVLGEQPADAYFRELPGGRSCFIEGTDFAASASSSSDAAGAKCACLPDYHGPDCGIPGAVWHSHFGRHPRDRKRLRARTGKHARRIVHGVLVNHEEDFFETRVRELDGVVDAYIVQESNFTTFGTPKKLQFLDRFKSGWLGDQQDKMIYVLLPFFKEKGKDNGWYADAYIRMYLSKQGLPKIKGLRDDDLFLLLDADELPSREVLLFLKLYDGYTEPVRFGFRWTVFGFFWLKATDPSVLSSVPLIGKLAPAPSERLLQLYVICTVGMLRKVYGNNAMLMRRNVWENELLKQRVHNYTKREGHVIKAWDAGSLGHYAGHHCSWCYSPEGIRTKLLSAQKHDKPRWGDFPEKTELSYISGLIETGGWFDDTRPLLPVPPEERAADFYAPKFIRDNPDRFAYLLENKKTFVGPSQPENQV